MLKTIFLFLIACTLIEAKEVSVFGAGDLNSKNPYGLNSSEKHILKNKQKIKDIDSSFKELKLKLNSANERIEAIESIYEGDSKKLNSSVHKLNNLVNNIKSNKDENNKSSSEINELRLVSEQFLLMQEETNKNYNSLKDALSELTVLVNKINKNYISEREFKRNMKQFVTVSEFNALKESLGLKSQANNKVTKKTKSDKPLTSNDKKKILADAKKLFDKSFFKYAIPKFELLIKENYKPAESNYYLAEMWYVRKKYDLAVSHFKKSAILNDKAAYMPTLLLHSAISFERTNNKENARDFYSTLIDLYPNSSETKIAKQNLNKL